MDQERSWAEEHKVVLEKRLEDFKSIKNDLETQISEIKKEILFHKNQFCKEEMAEQLEIEKIEHQKQPCDKSCVSACIAMILGIDVSVIIHQFHDNYLSGKITPLKYLRSVGVRLKRGYTDQKLEHDKLYMLCVPSLNKRAINHEIILDTRGDEVVVYDPLKGVEGKNYYVWDKPVEELESNQFNVNGRCVDYIILT